MSVAPPDQRAAALASMREEFGCLLGAERRLRGREQQRKGEDELSTAHVRALFALDTHKEATAGQIAEVARLSPGSVTGMLDDLERAGIVTRVRATDDRRWAKRWEDAMAGVSERDLEAAADVMRRIGALLDEI
jgi:predicted ArsR family transcriptional regulator